jgi:hypothetical protein
MPSDVWNFVFNQEVEKVCSEKNVYLDFALLGAYLNNPTPSLPLTQPSPEHFVGQ